MQGGGAIVQDVAFNDLIGADGGKVVTASNTTLSSITAENILVGDVTLQWSAIDS